ncbi:MAG: exopolyphosphatase [Pseudomonadota bacterium]
MTVVIPENPLWFGLTALRLKDIVFKKEKFRQQGGAMRLITRADFDGLVCAMLLREIGIVNEYLFVHPKDMQDGKIKVTNNDALANVPYALGCALWFDHHSSEQERLQLSSSFKFKGASRSTLSCARVIYDYYGGVSVFKKFDTSGLMQAVDKCDSADFTTGEILEPQGWTLLSFILDARTGLERYKGYRINHQELMLNLINFCQSMSIEDILRAIDVRERVDRYIKQQEAYKTMLNAHCRTEQNLIIIDFRNLEEMVSGNRFIEYALYPQQNVSVRAMWGREKQNIVLTAGHSIITRTCNTDVGSLMLMYRGGGHRKVAACQVPAEDADRVFTEIINLLKKNG